MLVFDNIDYKTLGSLIDDGTTPDFTDQDKEAFSYHKGAFTHLLR